MCPFYEFLFTNTIKSLAKNIDEKLCVNNTNMFINYENETTDHLVYFCRFYTILILVLTLFFLHFLFVSRRVRIRDLSLTFLPSELLNPSLPQH